MRIGWKFDYKKLFKLFDNVEDLENQFRYKEVSQKLLNATYARIYRKHSSPYSYFTPVDKNRQSARKNLRRRSGRLLNLIKNSRFMRQLRSDTIEMGFDLKTNEPRLVSNVKNVEKGGGDFKNIKADGPAMTIPLKEALYSNGTKRRRSMRAWGSGIKTTTVEIALEKGIKGEPFSLNGETLHPKSRIVCIKKGETWVPLYLLVRKVRIPKRMDISEDFDYVWQAKAVEFVQKEFDRILARATTNT